MKKGLLMFWGMSLLLASCSGANSNSKGAMLERQVKQLNLSSKMKRPTAEYSALAWCQNSLIMVPQYPEVMCEEASGCLYQITERDLEEALKNPNQAVKAKEIILHDHGVKDQMVGYEGYEALSCDGDTAFLSVEAKTESGMRAYLLRGTLDLAHSRLDLDEDKIATLLPQADRNNASYEAIMAKDGVVYAFYEHYNRHMTPNNYIYRFDYELTELEPMTGFDLWYRLTDIGGFDAAGTLWVMNYNFPKSAHKSEANGILDPLAEKYGEGATHKQSEVVERIVPMTFSAEHIDLAPKAPIQLELLENGGSRNWEGLAIWPGHGFLMVTDKFPGSILGYVPFEK